MTAEGNSRSTTTFAQRMWSGETHYCNDVTEIGNFPHVQVFFCDREKGHDGPHTAEVTWEDGEEPVHA